MSCLLPVFKHRMKIDTLLKIIIYYINPYYTQISAQTGSQCQSSMRPSQHHS